MLQLEAQRAASLADLAVHRSNRDADSMAASIQELANIDAETRNLGALYQQYVASQNPPQPPEPSPEERQARPIHRMDWQDVTNLARTSKYARDIQPNDPNLIAGWNEAMRRRSRGE
jgi:hypothetical protein